MWRCSDAPGSQTPRARGARSRQPTRASKRSRARRATPRSCLPTGSLSRCCEITAYSQTSHHHRAAPRVAIARPPPVPSRDMERARGSVGQLRMARGAEGDARWRRVRARRLDRAREPGRASGTSRRIVGRRPGRRRHQRTTTVSLNLSVLISLEPRITPFPTARLIRLVTRLCPEGPCARQGGEPRWRSSTSRVRAHAFHGVRRRSMRRRSRAFHLFVHLSRRTRHRRRHRRRRGGRAERGDVADATTAAEAARRAPESASSCSRSTRHSDRRNAPSASPLFGHSTTPSTIAASPRPSAGWRSTTTGPAAASRMRREHTCAKRLARHLRARAKKARTLACHPRHRRASVLWWSPPREACRPPTAPPPLLRGAACSSHRTR